MTILTLLETVASSTGAGALRPSPHQASGRTGRPVPDLKEDFPAPHDAFGHAEVKAVKELPWRRGADAPPQATYGDSRREPFPVQRGWREVCALLRELCHNAR